MDYLFVWCSDDGETRVVMKTSDDAASFLAELGRTVIHEPPETDPCYWPEGVVLVVGIGPFGVTGAS